MESKFILTLLLCSVFDMSESTDLSGFLQQLDMLAHQLGYNKMNDVFRSMNVTTQALDGETLLEKLTLAVETKFNATKEALLQLRNSTKIHNVTKHTKENHIEKRKIMEQRFPKCCSVPENVNNLDGRLKDVKYDGCVFTSQYATAKHSDLIPNDISDAMKKNMENNKDLKWQYVALANGSLFLYPARRLDDCESFDARNRSWFVEASTVHSKDVVIVLDVSGSMELTNSMGKSLMNIAKTGAKMVINTLNSKDKVGVVAFSDEAIIPRDYNCFTNQLAAATPQNKRCLNHFIDSLQGRGLTNYMAGLKKAFEYFRNTNSANKDRILLFLSDGMPSSGGGRDEILKLVHDEAAYLNNSVIILTFGIGKALQDENNRQLLMDMANYTEDSNHYRHPRGHFTAVKCSNDMRQSIADYYVYMHSYQETSEPVFTLPYFDAGRLGYVMSMCLPLQADGKFLGVTCIDIRIRDLLDDVINFRHGELSYAFLINYNGQAVFHPLLPKPLSLNQDIGLIDIASLERDTSAQQVIASMKQGEYGRKTLLSQRTVSRGASEDGIHVLWVNSTYYWAPIRGSNYSVCIVITSHDQRLTFPNVPVQSFVYHDFMKQNITTSRICKRSTRLEARVSTVKFPPNAFCNSLEYKNDNETVQNVSDIVKYMEGKIDDPGIFQDGIRGSVNFTSIAGKIWSTNEFLPNHDQIPFVWQCVATIDGVLQSYPGVYINKLYDPRQRPWFKRTLNNKGKLVFTRPYEDAWGAGYVITISKAICNDGCRSFSDENPVAAVIAADIAVDYFHEMLVQSIPACVERYKCLVIDSSGYVVFNDSFIFSKNAKTNSVIDSIHITVKEQEIANQLIKGNILNTRGCINVATFQNKYFWEITEISHRVHHMNGFSFYAVDQTNIFIIVKDTVGISGSSPLRHPCTVVKSYIEDRVLEREIKCEGIRKSGTIVDCACTSQADFNYCENTFDLLKLSDMWPTCIPDDHQVDMSNGQDNVSNVTVQPCPNLVCELLVTQTLCRTKGCKWCIVDSNGDDFKVPFCSNDSFCQSLNQSEVVPEPTIERLQEDSTNSIILGSCIAIVAAVILGVTIFCCRRRRRKHLIDDRSKLIGNQVRVSMAELGKDNASMLWSGVFSDALSGSSLPVISEDIPLERMQSNSHMSSSSNSIHFLAQRVEALVHRLESQESGKSSAMANPPFTKPIFPASSTGLVYGYRSSSQSDVSRPSSYHYSLPRTISNSSVLSSPKSSSLPSSNGNKISRTPSSDSAFHTVHPNGDQVVILRPKPGRFRKMFPIFNTLSRSASEHTWPGDLPVQGAGLNGDREPSERTCPASVASSTAWPREKETGQSRRLDEEAEWDDADEEAQAAKNSQTLVPSQSRSSSRTSSFRHRTSSRTSPRLRSSRRERSRSLPSPQMSDETIRKFIRERMKEIADEVGVSFAPAKSQGSAQSIASCPDSTKDNTIIEIPADECKTVNESDNVLGKEKVN